MFPQLGIVVWLSKHAYEYSQPITTLYLSYIGQQHEITVTIETNLLTTTLTIQNAKQQTIQLGHISQNPEIIWQSKDNKISHILNIKPRLKAQGKNIKIKVTIDDEQLNFSVID